MVQAQGLGSGQIPPLQGPASPPLIPSPIAGALPSNCPLKPPTKESLPLDSITKLVSKPLKLDSKAKTEIERMNAKPRKSKKNKSVFSFRTKTSPQFNST